MKSIWNLQHTNEIFFPPCSHFIMFCPLQLKISIIEVQLLPLCCFLWEKQKAAALLWTTAAQFFYFLKQRQIKTPEKVSGCNVHHQGVFLFSDSSHVLRVNRLINRNFSNSIKGSVMVHKVRSSVDPRGDPRFPRQLSGLLQEPSEGSGELSCDLFMERFTVWTICSYMAVMCMIII